MGLLQEANHAGYGTPDDTYRPEDQGTAYPEDRFTAMVLGGGSDASIAAPVANSYAGDGNMEAYEIVGEYVASNEGETDLGRFTGAIGPAGRATPAAHPEVTAPGAGGM